jgi:hypothetical protein
MIAGNRRPKQDSNLRAIFPLARSTLVLHC